MIPVFEKISFEQWYKDLTNLSRHTGYVTIEDSKIKELYDNIQIPNHSLEMANGYYFRNAYVNIHTKPYYPSWYEPCIVPTGIRVSMESNLVLQIHSYHVLSRCHNLIIADGVQLVPSEYSNYEEGHIVILLRNLSMLRHMIKTGDIVGIGIFTSVVPIGQDETNCPMCAPIAPAIVHSPHMLTSKNMYYKEDESGEYPIGGRNRANMSFI